MPPKKETTSADGTKLLTGFEDKETKLLAAAFVSCIGTDKYDYELMGTLTSNTAGSLKKMWPPVKKKAIEAHPSFAGFLGNTGSNVSNAKVATHSKAAPKAGGGRKKKAAAAASDAEADAEIKDTIKTDPEVEDEPEVKPKKTAAPRKRKATVAPAEDEPKADAEAADEPEVPAKRRGRSASVQADGNKSDSAETKTKKKAAAPKAKGSRAKKVKKEGSTEEEGGDGEAMDTIKEVEEDEGI